MNALWPRLCSTYSPSVLEFWGTLLTPTSEQSPTASDLRACLRVVVRNQLLSAIVHLSLLCLNYRLSRPPAYSFSPTIPPPSRILADIVACVLLREILFYYAHRLLHTPRLYARVHKAHHRFTAPVTLAAQYAHPLEHLLATRCPSASRHAAALPRADFLGLCGARAARDEYRA
ncbi:hypothetical protein MMC26_007183 [Xylographa opegraphella]|nr:hypothetical protein [Xylographa opegraphella]